MKKILYTIPLLALPLTALAHVRWFAEEKIPVRAYSLSDSPVLIWIAIAFILIMIGIYLEKIIKIPKWFHELTEKFAPYALSIASIGFGLSFLIFSYNGFIFAPNLLANGYTDLLIIIQALAGIMILLGLYERVGGLLLIIIFILGINRFGFLEMIDALEIVGFALYAIIVGRPKFKIVDIELFGKLRHKIHPYGLALLRVGTGLNLIILGFSEKILAPSLTADFLSTHSWNFMQKIGFESFTNYWFAFSAGSVEIMFGIFLLLGLVTRITTFTLAIFLIITLVLLGPIELIGHLPHFSIAIVLLILGSGTKLKLIRS